MIVARTLVPYFPTVPSSKAAKSAKRFHRNTQQRHQIREVFEGNDRPLAADEVLQLAEKKTAELGMATFIALAWLLLATAESLDTLADDHRHEHKRCQRIRPLPAECKV